MSALLSGLQITMVMLFFDMNIVTGAKGFPNKVFLHALDGYTFKFYGEDFPLKPILESVEKLNVQLLAAIDAK